MPVIRSSAGPLSRHPPYVRRPGSSAGPPYVRRPGAAERTRRILPAALVFLLLAMPVRAHHAAPTEFDLTKPMVLRGTLTKMLWANPHGWMYLDVRGPEGQVTSWMVETGSPNTLYRLGWRRTDLLPGTDLVIDMFPARNGDLKAHATRVSFGDGRVLVSETTSPTAGDGLRHPKKQ